MALETKNNLVVPPPSSKAWRGAFFTKEIFKHGASGYSKYGCRCAICKEAKAIARRKFYNSPKGKTLRKKEIASESNVRYKKSSKYKSISKFSRIKSKYGVTREQYTALLNEQDGHCACCISTKNLSVDHDHETGRVRGILCKDCNTSLGFIKESIPTLQNLIEYLLER